MTTDVLLTAFGLTLFAGLATSVGGALAVFVKKTNTRILSVSLGFAAGVMIYVSFVEIFQKARESLSAEMGEAWGSWATVVAFFAGMGLVAIIDKLVPPVENPHEIHKLEEMAASEKERKGKLMRMGMLSALAIAIHNFPEGLATFTSAIKDPALGFSITMAIAIHNIPEGLAVAIPIYYSTGSRLRAFIYSSLSGLAEPIGAGVGFLVLLQFFNDVVFGVVFASVAGIMVFISLDQLLPTAREYGEHHLTIYGMVAGMGLMALSLLMFL